MPRPLIALPLRLFVHLLTPILVLCGCQPETPPKSATVPTLETARRVSQVTAGVISSRDEIRVRFVDEVVDEGRVGHSLKNIPFAFEPPVVGTAFWQSQHELLFKPNRPWELRRRYLGRLDLASLFPATESAIPPLEFEFLVAGREVASLNDGFSLIDAARPHELVYDGQVEFTERTELHLLEGAASLTVQSLTKGQIPTGPQTPLALKWEALEGGRRFAFTSAILRRDDSTRRLVLNLEADALELSGEHRTETTLAPLREMRLLDIEAENGEEPRVHLKFSDEINPRQDLRGLVAVEPPVDFEIKASGDKATLSGSFSPGREYHLTVHPGIASRWGSRSANNAQAYPVTFADLKPQLRFGRDGAFLPGQRQGKLRFWTLNLQQVRLEVKRVFESNLGQFLQTERLESARDRRDDFNHSYVNRVGLPVYDDSLQIGSERNRWLEHELDLASLLQEDSGALYLVSLRFEKRDMLYGTAAEAEAYGRRHRWDPTNPYSSAYIYAHGRVYKPVALSDLGLLYKRGAGRHLIWATRVGDASPLPQAEITLYTYQNQVIASGLTDESGRAEFDADAEPFYIEARSGGQRSVLKPGATAWNLSTFDTEGVEAGDDGPRVFVYTERGVYRPGDPVHLGLVVRHTDDTFPSDHPVGLKVFNPRGQLVQEQTRRQSQDGFYAFSFSTRPKDPTGNWRARLEVGASRFDHTVRVETVVPFKLKTEVEPAQKHLAPGDSLLELGLTSAYLFGAPAAGLKTEVDVRLQHQERRFKDFSGYTFTDESRTRRDSEHRAFSGKLDAQGKTRVRWSLPQFEPPPSALRAHIQARVFEPGGRPNRRFAAVDIDPYPAYVGVKKPEFDYGYARIGEELELPLVALDPEGNPLGGRRLVYRIWHGAHYWWWEYDDRQTYMRRFRSTSGTRLVLEGEAVSAALPVRLPFSPEEAGEYLVEIQDGENGHTTAFFMRAYAWGAGAIGEGGEATLALRADRPLYAPGDTALVRFPVPARGTVLFTLEKGGRVLEERRYALNGDPGEFSIPIGVSPDMLPGVYASVALLQPYGQTLNDRPLRTYGVLHFKVEDPLTRIPLELELPPSLRPDAPFRVGVRTGDGQPVQFTLAVVDEGLLSLTDFRTPDPWEYFYRKQRLAVQSYDIFGLFLGALGGDVFKTFSIGGDLAADRLGRLPGSDIDPDKRDRFAAVSLFEGPLETDAQGRATVDFDLPNYIGAVRVMAVAARGRRYGNAEATLPVKTELLLLPSLPRFVGPGDSLKAAVSVFALDDSLGEVEVSVQTQGPLVIAGESSKALHFIGQGTRELTFDLVAPQAVGQARIAFEAQAAGRRFTREIAIEVRPAAPRIYSNETRTLQPNTPATLAVPALGLQGTNRARLRVQRLEYNLSNHLYRLLRYPYGCIEQTVSAAFPQLYLKEFMAPADRPEIGAEIDAHLNAAVERLRRFQLPDGSFSYWPGNSSSSVWGGLYAGHFLVEAAALGYHVPPAMLESWKRYEHSQSLLSRNNLMTRVYRVYVLALAGEAAVGPMNLLKENSLDEMRPVERWLLAAAYRMTGMGGAATDIARGLDTQVEAYREFAGTYGSALRDRALILNAALTLEKTAEADTLAQALAPALADKGWYSTQETAAVLLALGKYLKSQEGGGPRLRGHALLPGGKRVDFDTDEFGFEVEIESGFGDTARVYLHDGGLARAFAVLDWDGVPLKNKLRDEEKNLNLAVEWLDEDGRRIDPANLQQGTAFWGHFRVSHPGNVHSIAEVALAQLLPAGWEIDNTRLSGEKAPPWMKDWALDREEYVDLRDEGAVFFFDLQGRNVVLDFALKLNAVTPGSFTLPPTTVEAMYDRNYRARRGGGRVAVKK